MGAGGRTAWRWGGCWWRSLAWLAVLLPWCRDAGRDSAPADTSGACTSRSAAWAVTDLVVLLAWGT